ncbi:MAG: tetratricopeptide repeat protein [Hydrogenophilales bacterium]|nr:tetratricopeptide repeat protein [Hydrogenophilales bacterium]
MAEMSRNAPCPCGSGLKYKHCHGRGAEAPGEPGRPSADLDFSGALRLHQSGLISQAVRQYQAILAQTPDHPGALHYLGVALYQQGRCAEAEPLIREALRLNPAEAMAANNLGLVLGELGQVEEALHWYTQALVHEPGNVQAYSNRGLIYAALREYDKALADFDQALALQPRFDIALVNRGKVLLESGREDEGVAALEAALALNPNRPEVHINLGNAWLSRLRYDAAADCFERALRINPEIFDANAGYAVALSHLNRLEEALHFAVHALDLRPLDVNTHVAAISIMQLQGDYDQALAAGEKALGLIDADARLFAVHARTLLELNKLVEAQSFAQRAYDLDPNALFAANVMTQAYIKQTNLDAAAAWLDIAIALDPEAPSVHLSRGKLAREKMQIQEAMSHFERGLKIAPDDPALIFAKSELHLIAGQLETGWSLYESRRVRKKPPPFVTQPEWQGETIQGSLLVWSEQGLGDQIMFATLVPELSAYADRIGVTAAERLLPLFRRSFPGIEFMPHKAGTVTSGYASQIAIASLPRLLRRDMGAFAQARHRDIQADTQQVTALRRHFSPNGNLVCGLSWGSVGALTGLKRTLTLEMLLPLLAMPGVDFVDLQYLDSSQERKSLAATHGLVVRKVEEIDNRQDLDGLAALMSTCDLVISIDNTNAHLAAALGRPTWILLPYSSDWRWFMGRDDSPWYPSVRLFRQSTPGDWGGVVEAVTSEMAALLREKTHRASVKGRFAGLIGVVSARLRN